MRSFKLNNGVSIPAIGFGSYLATEKSGTDAICQALDAGYDYIDTASFYNNEDQIGQAIISRGVARDKLIIASKVWPTMLGYEKTRESFEESCGKLKTDYLDIFLIHLPLFKRR